MHAIKRTLDFIGDTISFTTPSGVTVELRWIREGVYRVEVLAAGPVATLVEDLCGSYSDEATARLVARGYALMYAAEANAADAAEVLRVDITDAIAEAMRRRNSRRVAQLNRLADRLETPAERALVDDVRAHLTAVHGGGAALPARSWREIRDRHRAALARDRQPAA
ncbi:hypothetical protein RB614_13325 [Phytohabitans sp. ZYX-F-186]|uniref:Uncharacterized protein n=1 Tax=Phytohabitans maris TaxID=3071409 RepID=A0ABU0ZEM2_9ACTN|nr:hypothetical protein [Phytohabitans sp. ZYX-F-186]MDQ7905505.1 hypothetical protein [Phytohabitans sp. ZYX-F-186]